MFKVPATGAELRQLTEIARRLAWLEAPEARDGEWSLSDAGRALRRPPSLAIVQVVSRVLSIANPVRTQAKDWLPLLAVVAGAVAGGVAGGSLGDLTTADVVRALSITVLAGSILWQFYGEVQIVRAMRRWNPKRPLPGCEPAVALYRPPRLGWAIVLDLATVTAFGLLVFHQFVAAARRGRCDAHRRHGPSHLADVARIGDGRLLPRPARPTAVAPPSDEATV